MKSRINFRSVQVKQSRRKTIFKNRVYQAVKGIPKEKVITYKRVAELVGSPKAWRAVGNILNKNKDPKIPCHRVIKSDRKIGGYKNGIKKKSFLLKKEGVKINKYGKIASRFIK